MKNFESRTPARVRRAIAAATVVARYFYGEKAEVEEVVEQGRDNATGINVSFGTAVGRRGVMVHLRKFRGYRTEFWAVVGLEVGGRSFWDDSLAELSDRLPGGLPHLGLEHVPEREMTQLALSGIESEPAQGHLSLGYDSGLRLFC